MSQTPLSLAGFQVILIGRFWVIAEDQIAKKPMLILLDETVQQVRVAPAETASNCAGIGFHRIRVAISYGVHATRIYGRGDKKDAGWETFSYSALSYLY